MIQRLTRWRTLLLAVVAALSIVVTNCATSQQPAPNASPAAGGSPAAADPTTLIFGSAGQPARLEPGNVEDSNSNYVLQQIYDRLIDFEPGTTTLIPALATEWASSEDALTWTFKLRQGVKFHDGTDLNAAAVKANIERWWDPQSPIGFRDAGRSYEIWTNLFGGFKGEDASVVKAVNAPDDQTVEIVLNEPFSALPAALASSYFGIASPAAIEKSGANYGIAGGASVGTGPYIFREWRTGDRIVLEANPNYWREGFPKMKQLVFRFITEPSARLAELRAGGVDFTIDLAPDQLRELQNDPNLQEVRRPSFNVGYLALNPSYEPLAKKEVRQAIAMAINKKEIVEAFWSGLGSSDGQFTPPSLKQHQDPNLTDFAYNPDQAKQMLAAAGYPNGFDLELWYMPVSRPYFPTPKPIAEALAADLGAIGIRAKLNTKDWAAYLDDRNKAPGYQAYMLGWTGDYGDPDNFYYAHFGRGATQDLGNWKDEQIFKLLDQARQVPEPERPKLYAQVSRLIHDQALRIPIVHSEPLLGQRTNISGWVPSPRGNESFEAVEKT
jgi:peptide/nickel transport system substrate-binding protein